MSCRATVAEGTKITLAIPDDFHHHFRDGPKIESVVKLASQRFRRAIAMPNLNPPVVNTEMAMDYHRKITSCIPDGCDFQPLMTLYLTDNTTPEEIKKAHASGVVFAAKYYPAGATTNSAFGVSNVKYTYPAIRAMEECNMMLCIHSEVSRDEIDIFDREAVFIEEVMKPLANDFPNLKIVMEHISTESAVEYVLSAPDNVKASITCHHLLYNRNALLVGGIKPHFYCLPILKREKHRLALIKAATSGNSKFFAGTDSAPHDKDAKESACGCAGVFTAHAAVELYAEAFEIMGKLDKLEAFCSHFGADHYGLPRNTRKITLEKKSWTVPAFLTFGDDILVPLRAKEKVLWSIVE